MGNEVERAVLKCDLGGQLSSQLPRAVRVPSRGLRIALALAVLAIAGPTGGVALGSTGTATVIDKTISCRLRTALSSASFSVDASIIGPYAGGVTVSGAGYVLYAGAGKAQVLVPTAGAKPIKTGYYTDSGCVSSQAHVSLSPSGLRSLGVFSASGNADVTENCSVASNSTITIRLRVVLSKPGVPTSAQLAIRGGKHPRPIAFVNWTRSRFRAYVAAGCEQS